MPISPLLNCHVAGRKEGGLPKVTEKIHGTVGSRLGGPWSPLCCAALEMPRERSLLWAPPVTLCCSRCKIGDLSSQLFRSMEKSAGMVSLCWYEIDNICAQDNLTSGVRDPAQCLTQCQALQKNQTWPWSVSSLQQHLSRGYSTFLWRGWYNRGWHSSWWRQPS